jgi:hypothetical protein
VPAALLLERPVAPLRVAADGSALPATVLLERPAEAVCPKVPQVSSRPALESSTGPVCGYAEVAVRSAPYLERSTASLRVADDEGPMPAGLVLERGGASLRATAAD